MPAAAEPEIPQDVSISDELLMNFQRLRRGSSPDLPATVTKLETAEGCKVYLVGTAHFSKESQDDVEKVCLVCFIQGNQQGFKTASTLYMCNASINIAVILLEGGNADFDVYLNLSSCQLFPHFHLNKYKISQVVSFSAELLQYTYFKSL